MSSSRKSASSRIKTTGDKISKHLEVIINQTRARVFHPIFKHCEVIHQTRGRVIYLACEQRRDL